MNNCCPASLSAPPCAGASSADAARYRPFTLDVAREYLELFRAMPTRPLTFSLPNLWGWRDWIDLEIRFACGLAWLRCNRRNTGCLGPVGDWERIDWSRLTDELKAQGTIWQVPEPLVRIWEQRLPCPIVAEENRDTSEYLYNTADLAELAGNRYHTQRNHVNAYIRAYGEPDVRILDKRDIPDMRRLACLWLETHEDSHSARPELHSMDRVWAEWDRLDIVACGVRLDDRLVAFSVGHALDADTMAVLYEKAEPGLRGAFPVMTRAFARTAASGHCLLNRAEDMGDPGIRNAKMLYRPVGFQRMFNVRVGD